MGDCDRAPGSFSGFRIQMLPQLHFFHMREFIARTLRIKNRIQKKKWGYQRYASFMWGLLVIEVQKTVA